MKTKHKLACIILLFSSGISGQMNQYNYKRELTGIKDQWHKLAIPDDVFGRISHDYSDIRIYGITSGKDTLEAPYMLQPSKEKVTINELKFNLINCSNNENGYYFTFELNKEDIVNELLLDFAQHNFDWKINLEGSQNQQEWFSITKDYRILSIKNEQTDFRFTTIKFPDSKYRYFRLLIKTHQKPELKTAKILLKEVITGNIRNFKTDSLTITQIKKYKQTVLNIKLAFVAPVSSIKINVKSKFDFYRPINIQYLSDSVKTTQGWVYIYDELTDSTLNSLDTAEFKFSSTLMRKFKITIQNYDNTPLNIGSVEVKGFDYELVGRFDSKATYYLVYGNKDAVKPQYDIEKFTTNIPTDLVSVEVEKEQKIVQGNVPQTEALFQNKIWLWAVMGLIIVVLGWFTLKMIGKK